MRQRFGCRACVKEMIPGNKSKGARRMGPEEWKSQHKGGVIQISVVGTGTQFGWNFSKVWIFSRIFHLREERMKPGSHIGWWLMSPWAALTKLPSGLCWYNKARVWERLKAESRIILYLLELGPCQQELNLSSQQMKQRWTKKMRIRFQGICCIKQIYVEASYGTLFASIWPLGHWLRNSQTEFTESSNEEIIEIKYTIVLRKRADFCFLFIH